MKNQIKVGKLESAKRQLETAIILYFNDKDPISIHTLVCAAHEVIADITKKAGGNSLILEGNMIKQEYKNDFRKMVRKAKNFFKHGDNDSNDTIVFNPDMNDTYLIDTCEGYQLLTGEINPYFVIYRAWFHYKYPNVLNNYTMYQKMKNRFGDNKIEFFKSMLATSAELQ
ncbi:MAG: hypothetical protein Q7K21_06335 [Elusimicrobiota bacterium]|nr:hypothetical protein [Elusimicrobiota bacterium]